MTKGAEQSDCLPRKGKKMNTVKTTGKRTAIRRILAVAAALLLVFGLAACGNNSSDASDTSGSKKSSSKTITSAQKKRNRSKILIVYYSATGNTAAVAKDIAKNTGGTIFRIQPKKPYTDSDLDWNDENSRITKEHNNPNRHVALKATTVKNFKSYKTVFIGYPIWWQDASWVVDDFVKNNNFKGKRVIPFCTSMSSGIGSSGRNLAKMAGTGNWEKGKRFSENASSASVKKWVNGLGL